MYFFIVRTPFTFQGVSYDVGDRIDGEAADAVQNDERARTHCIRHAA